MSACVKFAFDLYKVCGRQVLRRQALLLLAIFAGCRNHPEQVVIQTDMGNMRFQLTADAPAGLVEELARLSADSLTISQVLQDGFIQLGGAGSAGGDQAALSGALACCEGKFYIIQGRPQTDAMLDKWQTSSGKMIPGPRREEYKRKGGSLQLENRCRVIGNLIAGREVLDRIAALPSDNRMRPLRRVHFRVEMRK